MRNFNRVALATALTISGGGGIVHAAELGEQRTPNYVESIAPNNDTLGNVAMQSSLDVVEVLENSNTSQVEPVQVLDEIQPVIPTETAVRTGNKIQLSEPPPPPETAEVFIPNYFNWLRLADCESGGDWAINTGNGYYGGLQFNLTSWKAVGGLLFAVRPDLASPEEQMLIAENLLDVQGWGAWPSCTRKLGLR